MADTIELRIVASGASEAARAFQSLADSGVQFTRAVASGSREATTSVNTLGDAFTTLKVKSTQEIAQAQNKLLDAYNAIKASGNVTAVDLQRAHAAMTTGLKRLSEEAGTAGRGLASTIVPGLQNMTGLMGQAGIQTGILGQVVGALTSPLGLAAAAFVGTALAVKSLSDAMVTNAKEVKALQAVSGLGAEAADNLLNTFALLGKESQSLTTSMFKMGSEIEGGGAAISKLGISLRDSMGQLKEEGALFLEVRDRLSAINNASERGALIMQIFGRSGRELASVFSLSREEFKKYMAEASKLSPWSEEAQKSTQEYIIATNRLSGAWQGLKVQLGEQLIPVLTRFTSALGTVLIALRSLNDWQPPSWLLTIENSLRWMVGQPSWQAEKMAPAMHDAAAENDLAGGPGGVGRTAAEIPDSIRLAQIKLAEQAEMQVIQRRENVFRESLARMAITEAEFTEREIALAYQRQQADLRGIKAREDLIREKNPGEGLSNPAVQEKLLAIQGERIAVQTKTEATVSALVIKTTQLTLAELKQVSDAYVAQAALVVSVEQANVDAAKSSALERVQIMESTEAAFIAQTNAEAQARVAALNETLGDTAEFAARGVEIMDNANAKIRHMLLDLATGGVSSLQRQWDGAVKVIDKAVTDGTLKFEEGEAAKFRIAQAGILARGALVESDIQTAAALYAMDATNFEAAENKKLRQEAANIDAIAAKRQKLVEDQVRINVERLAGINKAASDELAIAAGTVNAVLAVRQQEIDNLNALTTAHERFTQQMLEGLAAQQRAVGSFTGFFTIEFTRALTAGNDAWSNLSRIAQDTAQAMQRGFSDFFFDVLSDRFNNLKDVAQSVLDSMKRALADFLSSQLMRQIGESIASAFGVNVGAGGAALAVSANAAAVALVGLAQAAAQAAVAQGSTSTQIAALANGNGNGGGTNGVTGMPGMGSVTSSFLSNLQANWSAGQGLTGGLSNVFFGQAPTGVFGGGPDLGTAATSGIFGSGGTQSFFSSTPGFGTAGVMGNFVAGVGVAMNLYSAFSNLGSANSTGTLAGTVAGGVIGAFTPLGPLLGASLGGWIGGILGDLFGGGPSENWLKFGSNLQGTLTGEQTSVQTLQSSVVASKNLTDLAASVAQFRKDIEAAGVGGFVGLTAGKGLFAVPGIPGATGTPHEGGLLADFGPQINELNDVIGKVLDAFRTKLGTELPAEIQKLLPADLFAAFVAGPLAALKTRFDELTTSSSANADELAAFEEQIQAVGQAAIVYAQVGQQIAAMSGDLASMTQGAKDAARQALDAADKAVQDSRSRLAEAISGPEIVAAGQELQKAILDRYALERKLVEDIEKSIGDLLSTAGTSFLQTAGVVAALALQGGDSGPLETLRAGLDALGETSTSVTLRIWAVNASLQALVSAVPTAIRTGTMQTPGQITSAIGAGAGPSIATLGSLYGQATAAGDLQGALGILGQASTLIQGLAAAAISGVQQWAQQATEAANAAGQRITTMIQNEAAEKVKAAQLAGKAYIDAAQQAGQEYIDAINAEAKAKTEANDAAIAGLNAQKTAVQKVLEASREWQRVAESLRSYITQLRLGPQAPPDPMGQFQLAQTLYQQALAAFGANPTAAGAQGVQQSASDLLAAAQLIYTRPSPEYAALFNGIVAQLEAVQASAAARVTPEEQAAAQLASIDAQIQTLNESGRAIQESAQQQIQAVNDGVKAYVDGINAGVTAYVDSVNASAVSQIQAINDGVKTHVDAINAQAKTEIEGINKGLAATLAPIAAAQVGILGSLIGSQTDVLNAITGNTNVSNYIAQQAGDTVQELIKLNKNIGDFLAGATPHEKGTDYVHQGFAYLHEGEAVLNRQQATTWRAGRYSMPTATPTAARGGAGGTLTVSFEPGSIVIQGVSDPEKAAKMAVDEVERRLRGPWRDWVVKGKP